MKRLASCTNSEAGEPPTYFQHGVCAGHIKGKIYTTNGHTTWRFVVPGASGAADLTWTGRYEVI